MLTESSTGTRSALVNEASLFPWIVIPNMPGEEYPRYAHFMIRATYAALCAIHPDKRIYFANGATVTTLLPIVGTRIGMLSSVGAPSTTAVSELSECFHYDVKRAKLYVRAARPADTSVVSAFRAALGAAPPAPADSVELVLAWAMVAPTVLSYASAIFSAQHATQQAQYVQRAITEFLKTTMAPKALKLATLESALPWDSAEAASVSGYCEDVVAQWAVDPILAVTAERRIILDANSMARNNAREVQLKRKMVRARPASVATLPSAFEHSGMFNFTRDDRTVVDDFDDAASMATALMDDAHADIPGVSTDEVMPDDSVTTIGDRFTQQDIDDLRNLSAGIQHSAPTADVNAVEPSVRW